MYAMFCYVKTISYLDMAAVLAPGLGATARGRMALSRLRVGPNREALKLWHQRFLPMHFTRRNLVYNYQRRKTPYKTIKKALAEGGGVAVYNGYTIREKQPVQRGGTVDIVRKGFTERKARAAVAISSYPTRAVIKMLVPSYAALKMPAADRPHMAKEMTTVTLWEKRHMANKWEKEMGRMITAYSERITKNVP